MTLTPEQKPLLIGETRSVALYTGRFAAATLISADFQSPSQALAAKAEFAFA
jgi:hypothetical protein